MAEVFYSIMNPEETYKNPDWLREKYWEGKMTQYEIADLIGVNQTTISDWMIKLNITRRYNKVKYLDNKNWPDPLREYIDGILLGDGSMYQWQHTASIKIDQVERHSDWLHWLQKQLQGLGLPTTTLLDQNSNGFSNNNFFRLSLFGYAEWYDLYNHWYPSGKMIPPDVRVTPISCLLWYLGDGSLDCTDRKTPIIEFSTDSFSRGGLEILCSKLKKQGFHPRIRGKKKYPRIKLSAYDTCEFLDYYLPNSEEIGFDYKFPNNLIKYHSWTWLNEQYWEKGLSSLQMGQLIGISPNVIRFWMEKYNILRRNNQEAARNQYSFASDTYQSKEWMKREYLEKEKSAQQIAHELGVGSTTINNWLDRLGVSKRTASEKAKLMWKKRRRGELNEN